MLAITSRVPLGMVATTLSRVLLAAERRFRDFPLGVVTYAILAASALGVAVGFGVLVALGVAVGLAVAALNFKCWVIT